MAIKININLTNKWLYSLIAIGVVIIFAWGVVAYVNPSTGVGHGPEEIGPGTFAGGAYIFPNGSGVMVLGKITSSNTEDTDSDNTVVTKSYVDSTTIYSICSWYNGRLCPIVDSIQFMMVGYSSTQVQCCGKSGVTCTPYGWTTYDTFCSADCTGQECGTEFGYIVNRQRRLSADCLMEYREVTTSTWCSEYCGGCPTNYYCQSGSCEYYGGGP